MTESKYVAEWEKTGRYLVVYGIKTSSISKADKSIKFYNVLGEPLLTYDKVPALMTFKWRPRPTDILKPREI